MPNERLDPRAVKRLSGISWEKVRPQFMAINDALLSASPTCQGILTTIYIKYIEEGEERPYAVLWAKKSTELVLGLAMPEGFDSPQLEPPLKGYVYAGLTAYLRIGPGDSLPENLATWARLAHSHVMTATDADHERRT